MVETALFYKGQSMGKSECQQLMFDEPAVVDKMRQFIANRSDICFTGPPGTQQNCGFANSR